MRPRREPVFLAIAAAAFVALLSVGLAEAWFVAVVWYHSASWLPEFSRWTWGGISFLRVAAAISLVVTVRLAGTPGGFAPRAAGWLAVGGAAIGALLDVVGVYVSSLPHDDWMSYLLTLTATSTVAWLLAVAGLAVVVAPRLTGVRLAFLGLGSGILLCRLWLLGWAPELDGFALPLWSLAAGLILVSLTWLCLRAAVEWVFPTMRPAAAASVPTP